MAKIHDKFVIELAEVIKGYGNDPDVDDPFCLSEFYRFYELPEIAVSENHFKTMIPLEVEKAKGREERKRGRWIIGTNHGLGVKTLTCSQCGYVEVSSNIPNFCGNCGADMRGKHT